MLGSRRVHQTTDEEDDEWLQKVWPKQNSAEEKWLGQPPPSKAALARRSSVPAPPPKPAPPTSLPSRPPRAPA